MTYKGKPYANNYEKRIYEAKEVIRKSELTENNYEKRIYEAKEVIRKSELTENNQDWGHEIYPRIGTSDRQRAYLVKHGIKHVRKDGEYK